MRQATVYNLRPPCTDGPIAFQDTLRYTPPSLGRYLLKIAFHDAITTKQASEIIAGIYRVVSGDQGVIDKKSPNAGEDDDRRVIVDSNGHLLFGMGELTRQDPSQRHYVGPFNASSKQQGLLIGGLERECSVIHATNPFIPDNPT